MKILAVSHEFPPIGGGGANACYFLTKGFVEQGHQVTLVTANYNNMPKEEEINGVHVIRINALRRYKEHCSFKEMMSYLLKAYPVADKLCRKEKFELCLVFFGIPSGPIGYILKKKYKLPYVIRFGGGDIPGFQERFTKVYKLIGPAIKAIWRNADALVANSQGLKDMALQYYSKKNFEVICNGVDTKIFFPIERKETAEFSILFVSRLIERKGLQYIIPMLNEIQENTDKIVKLIVVGDGPYATELENLTRNYGVEHMVCFIGQKNKNEIVHYYQNGDVFILPSKKEGMPNVVLEAMACGLPIIMTPCEGSKELIENNGFVIPIDEFKEKIIELANRKEQCAELGKNSKILVDLKFGWERSVDNYLKLLKNLCKQSQERK